MSIVDRFHNSYEPVTECGCWLWTKATYGRGYGSMFLTKTGGPRTIKAHRFSWELHNGPIPDGLHVLHKCDVRTCVNPDHLYLGDNTQNIKDRMERGPKTGLAGEKHLKAKLSEQNVRDIRLSELPTSILAKKYNVKNCTIRNVKRRKTWVNVR